MKIFYTSFVRFLLFLACAVSFYSNTIKAVKPSARIVEDIIDDTYTKLGIATDQVYTPTMAYLARPSLRSKLNTTYGAKMHAIGLDYFKTLFSDILKREVDFKDNCRVFYHAQQREFILLQDIYNGLYEIAHKKKFQDFFMMRVPDKNYYNYTHVQDFVAYYLTNGQIKKKDFNYEPGMKELLLSVNPALFSNTTKWTECTFDYFLNSSSWWKTSDKIEFTKNIFKNLGYEHYFTQHQTEIKKLEAFLSASELNKTGSLLQIFIPERLVNDIAYRCWPGGIIYHPDHSYNASDDLNQFMQKYSCSDTSLDQTQFRLLVTHAMIDPQSGIKMFRYYNETANVKAYKTQLKALLDNIEHKEKAKDTNKKITLSLVEDDIVNQKFDNPRRAAVVNAANHNLIEGLGVCGAIFKQAGNDHLTQACQYYTRGCPIGQACITDSCLIKYAGGAHHIIHAVGPQTVDKQALINAYQNSLEQADEHYLTALAFPAISTEFYGYDDEDATPIALRAIIDYIKTHPKTTLRNIRLVTFKQSRKRMLAQQVEDYWVYAGNLKKLVKSNEIKPATSKDVRILDELEKTIVKNPYSKSMITFEVPL